MPLLNSLAFGNCVEMIFRLLFLSILASARPAVRPVPAGTMFDPEPRVGRIGSRVVVEFFPTRDILKGAVLVHPHGSVGDISTTQCWTFSRLTPPDEIPPREERRIDGLFEKILPSYAGYGSFKFLTVVSDKYPLMNNKRLYTVPTSDGGTSFCYSRVDAAETPTTEPSDSIVNDDCSICWNKIMHASARSIEECHHRFHAGCLSRWLRLHQTCPLCRSHVGSCC